MIVLDLVEDPAERLDVRGWVRQLHDQPAERRVHPRPLDPVERLDPVDHLAREGLVDGTHLYMDPPVAGPDTALKAEQAARVG